MAFRSLKNTFLSSILLSTFLSQFTTVLAVTGYANAFVDPELIISKNLNASTTLAQRTMQQWASSLTDGAPWSMYFDHIYIAPFSSCLTLEPVGVTFKSVAPPSGNKHDYLSYAP